MSAWLAQLHALEGPFVGLRTPGAWLYGVLAIGAGVRGLIAWQSTGSLDVFVWAGLVDEIRSSGLTAAYEGGHFTLNHPPIASLTVAGIRSFVLGIDGSWPAWFRLPIVCFDALTFVLLVRLFGSATSETFRRARYALAAAWWISPLAILYSAHHGNTDSIVACGLVATSIAVARGRPLLAGALIGASLWIKIPGVLAAPLFMFALPDNRDRARMVGAAGLTAAAGYVPWLFPDPEPMIRAVFLYPGLRIQTTTGMPIWGLISFLPDWTSIDPAWRDTYRKVLLAWLSQNTLISLIPMGFIAWARRNDTEAVHVAAGVAITYVVLYGLSNRWSFQYLAWSLPLWFALGWRFALPATALATCYVYGLYAWLTGDPLLLGQWDFVGQPDWPTALRLARDACILFFAVAALYFVSSAGRQEWRRWQQPAAVG